MQYTAIYEKDNETHAYLVKADSADEALLATVKAAASNGQRIKMLQIREGYCVADTFERADPDIALGEWPE